MPSFAAIPRDGGDPIAASRDDGGDVSRLVNYWNSCEFSSGTSDVRLFGGIEHESQYLWNGAHLLPDTAGVLIATS